MSISAEFVSFRLTLPGSFRRFGIGVVVCRCCRYRFDRNWASALAWVRAKLYIVIKDQTLDPAKKMEVDGSVYGSRDKISVLR